VLQGWQKEIRSGVADRERMAQAAAGVIVHRISAVIVEEKSGKIGFE
jgi:hypothetical protein